MDGPRTRRLPTTRARNGLLVALTVLLPLACGDPTPELQDVPRPNLENREAAVRDQLEAAREELDRVLAQGELGGADLGRRFGDLGRLYHAYALTDEALVAFANARALDADDPRWSYYPAVLLAERGELDEAERRLREVLALRPDGLPARLRLADLLFNRGDLEAAREAYRAVLALDAGSAAAHYGLGRIAAATGDPATAVERFEAALAADPGASMVHYPLSQALSRLGRDEEARSHLERRGVGGVRFDDPWLRELGELAQNTSGYLRTGSTAFLGEDYEAAEREYRRAVEADPRDPEARKSLASALAKLGRVDEATAEYRVALEIEPDNPLVLYNLAWLEERRGREEEALPLYREALELDPAFRDARIGLALLLERRGRIREALDEIDATLEIDPQDPAATLARPRLLGALGRHDEALAELSRLVQADPSDAESRMALGLARAAAGDIGGGLATLREAVPVAAPGEVRSRLHYNIGVLEARRGDDAAAARAYEEAVTEAPDFLDGHFHRATALGRLGRYEEAAAAYSELLERAPSHHGARMAKATALTLLGRCADAATTIEEGLQRAPGQPMLALTLARLLAACPDERSRDGRRALELAETVHRTLRNPESAETLAMALAEVGRFADAVSIQRRVVEEARERGDDNLVERTSAVLAEYESGRAFRLPVRR